MKIFLNRVLGVTILAIAFAAIVLTVIGWVGTGLKFLFG